MKKQVKDLGVKIRSQETDYMAVALVTTFLLVIMLMYYFVVCGLGFTTVI